MKPISRPRSHLLLVCLVCLFLGLTVALPFAATLLAGHVAHAAKTKDEMVKMLKEVDVRQNSQGDWHSHIYMEQKEKDKVDVVYEGDVYRRSEDQKFVIVFTKPKASQGQGYLRIDQNLWFYDPSVGRWERRTERERIGGTNSRRSDFDESRLAVEFTPELVGEGKLDVNNTNQHKQTDKPGNDDTNPIVQLWVDKAAHNILKRQESALSG